MKSKHGLFQITQKVFIRNGNLLLVMKDKKSGAGDLPGGRMNEDEFFLDWMDSLNRELIEELGSNFQVKINPVPIFVHKHRERGKSSLRNHWIRWNFSIRRNFYF